ncbi:MAG: F0F1 ATP synthase subunit gamma [Candidatus Omnitrophica bacterium]|nr:F0F1 ATP synthase subunit gamma [Candidatus Omnitrophota bacterium]
MIPLVKLKKDVQFNGLFTKIVDAMKGIAAARFYVLQRRLSLFEPFSDAAGTLLAGMHLQGVAHPFLRPTVQRTGVVLVTSDEGFLGGLNAQIISAGLQEAGANPLLMIVGSQGRNYVREAASKATVFPGIADATRFQGAVALRDHLVRQVLQGSCGRVMIAYPKALSFAVQQVQVESLIPCTGWIAVAKQPAHAVGLLWESDPAAVVEYVVTGWLAHRLDEIFAMSRLAELSARAVHLEGSYQELIRQGKKLKASYLRTRHEVIDRSIREISASQLMFHGEKFEEVETK